ncbi:tetratricopeptide repeat 28-like [Paramuricea clavata]|uniref:Tetratricopeptide repeat 28-like n=1 Tax=Paramuricea clavata TaxID=317549 RepID=A0A7D9J3D1_PARCT|nr:tetratricopeptide repeat 28-like [Paramuricea clavata]
MEEELDISVTVEQLRSAGTNSSKQVPALLKLGEWYLKKAKTIPNGANFTKANALYNAALVRSRSINHEIGEDQILRRIVETYREFLYVFAKDDDGISVDEIQNEIDSHKEFLANERRIFKERVDEIDSCFNTNDQTEDQYEIHAHKVHEVFRDIQDMYIRLVSTLVKECESRLGKPPCDYAIIALGSVARMEATPYSDLEFAILYSDPAIGDKINYFRVLNYFLHLKVINLGETILPIEL